MPIENQDNIQDIKLEDLKEEGKEVFSDTEISDEKLETAVNDNLEGLRNLFFQGENISELKKLDFTNDNWKVEAEILFDTWINNNTSVISGLEFSIFKEKEIDQKKETALKEYLSSSTLDLNTAQVQIELESLKNGTNQSSEKAQEYTDVPEYRTTEIIQGTVMYDKLKDEMGRDEAKIEQFGNKIHEVIDKYFQPNLDFLDSKVRDSMNVAIQFSLMEELTNMGSDDAESFFSTFGKSNKKNNSTMFFHLIKSFSIGGNYLKLGKRLENLKRYLSENKSRYGNGSAIQELTNPVNCKALLGDTRLDEYTTTKTIEFTSGAPEKKENIDISSLQAIANDPNIPITKKIIKKIEKSLNTADNLLDKRIDLYNDATGTYTSLSSAVERVIKPVKPLAKMVGFNIGGDYLIDFLGKQGGTIREIVDFLLGLIGFTGGLEGLHRKYITDNLDKGVEINKKNKAFISIALKYYQTNPRGPSIQEGTTIDKIPALKDQSIADKIPKNYTLLKKSLQKAINEDSSVLNPKVITEMGLKGYATVTMRKKIIKNPQSGKNETREEVENISVTNLEKFTDIYLQKYIPKLAKNEKFMNKITSPDDFAFATIGNLVLDHFFVEGIAIGALEKSEYGGQEIIHDNNIELGDKKLSNLSFDEAKLFAERVFGVGPATNLLLTLSEKNSCMISRIIALANHEGGLDFGRKNGDPNVASQQINIGTFQVSAIPSEIVSKWNTNLDKGKELLDKNNISYDSNYFKKISTYTDETADTMEKKAQTDLLVWLGFALSKSGVLEQLKNPNLSEDELKKLMSQTIQVGIADIGKGVANQLANNSITDYPNLA